MTIEETEAEPGTTPTAPKIFRCLAQSDLRAAVAHANPTRDPLRPFGNLPTGSYNAVRTVAAERTAENLRSYGAGARYVLNPVSGNALRALRNGRFGLLIHGGPLNDQAELRPTHGCLRVDDDTIQWLHINAPASFPVEVIDGVKIGPS